jgi:hypothetical protein
MIKNIFKKKEKNQKNVSENIVRIEVFRLLGDSVPYSIALFEAIQDKDSDNNLVLVEENNSFKDDVEIVQNKLLSDLKFTLDLSSLSLEEKINLVKKKIRSQESILKNIKDGYYYKENKEGKKEKIKVNIIDEELNLNKYKVFLEHLQNSGSGSYETIDFDGKKRIYYMYKNGLLYPIKYIKAKNTLYPDVSTKRKIYKSEQDEIDREFLNDNRGLFSGWKQYLFIGIILVFFIVNIYWSVQLYKGYNKFDESTLSQLTDMAEGSAIKCAYWNSISSEKTAKILENYEKVLNESNNNKNNKIKIG